jgi:hypothetical protein
MQSFTRLIREAVPDNPVARALEAILDSGLIVFSRDTKGRFVQLSETLSERAGLIASAGDSQPRNMKVFNRDGRLLAGSEYPSSITRTTGSAQRNQLTRIVSDDGRHIWLDLNTMPLERGPEGWSVLSVGADVTALVDSLEEARRQLQARAALLDIVDRPTDSNQSQDEVLALLSEAFVAIAPRANATVAWGEGSVYQTEPLHHGYGTPLFPRSGRFTVAHRERFTADHSHVNLTVHETDIYGSLVIAEMSNPVGSLIVAPFGVGRSERIGGIIVFDERPNGFSQAQIESLEHLARIAARSLPPAGSVARSA